MKYLQTAMLSVVLFSTADFALAQIVSTDTPSTSADFKVTVANEGNSSFSLTPLWFAFHDGSFDTFNAGTAASASLEMLAEDGIFDGLVADFDAEGQTGVGQGAVFAPGGFAGAPVIEPAETGTAFMAPVDPGSSRYFSFASMVIPSNDTFIGNDDPLAYEVFDGSGNINSPDGVFTIHVFGSQPWDSGTEENLGTGAAFSTIGGAATDTIGGVVGGAGDLSEFLNTGTLAGTTITDLIGDGELLATITIRQIPEPPSLVLALILSALWPCAKRAAWFRPWAARRT